MKKISTIVVALFLVFAMSQCKKNEQNTSESQGEAVTITLDVRGNNGAKVDVNTTTGTVDFENGDLIQVASGGKYVGTLSYNGTQFIGSISNAVEGYPLHFYFLGNVMPAETLTSGMTESCSVVISDQTEHLPVISYAPSDENFGTTTNFTAQLLNKCALVKFNVTTSSEAATCVTGFNNKVTVDFSENTVTPSQEGNGVITLSAGNGEKWAILLPQEALEEGEIGGAYSQDGIYDGICGSVPAIEENYYLPLGITVSVNHFIGALNGLFTVNANGNQINFSQGNLQYQASTYTWRFAENQWDFVGTQNPVQGPSAGTVSGSDNAAISESTPSWIDLFGWGTSGYNHGAVCYQPWSTSKENSSYYAYGNSSYNMNDQTGQADWGYNAISNGGNTENKGWRTLTKDEWYYIFMRRNTLSGIRWKQGTVNGVKGVILLPDNWVTSIYPFSNEYGYNSNIISEIAWLSIFEPNGAVFLPITGYRQGYVNGNATAVSVMDFGYYWSASRYNVNYNTSDAYSIRFYDCSLEYDFQHNYRYYGLAVRLVRDAE